MGKKEKQIKQKPLEKMTATELRTMAKDIPEITGAHGMNKSELVAVIKKAKGIAEAPGRKKNAAVTVRSIKEKIRALKTQKEAVSDDNPEKVDILRRRINRLKKKTRRFS